MREILFKAKKAKNENWSEEESYVYLNGKDYIIPWYVSEWYGVEIDFSTLCQYICFKDKNGVKIFENDKVKVCLGDDIKNGVVKFNQEITCFCIDFDGSFLTFPDFAISKKKLNKKAWIEVIGNLYDDQD